MLRFVLPVLLVVVLYFHMQPLLWVVADIPPLPSQVAIHSKRGVNAFDEQVAYRAVCFATLNTEQILGLHLQQPVVVVLTPDAKNYAYVLSEEDNLSREAAQAQAAFTNGSSHGNRVIVNIGDIELYNDALFIVAHEMAHQFQLGANMPSSRLHWLIEGISDYIAARAVASNLGESSEAQTSQLNQYRREWLRTMAKHSHVPALRELDSRQNWLTSAQAYGPVLPYRTAATAVFYLADTSGEDSFREFFLSLNKGMNPDQAFATAFGRSVDDFEIVYASWLQTRLREQTMNTSL